MRTFNRILLGFVEGEGADPSTQRRALAAAKAGVMQACVFAVECGTRWNNAPLREQAITAAKQLGGLMGDDGETCFDEALQDRPWLVAELQREMST